MLVMELLVYFQLFHLIYANLVYPKQWPSTKFHHIQKCINEIANSYFAPTDLIIFLDLDKKFSQLQLNHRPLVVQTENANELIWFRLAKPDAYILTLSQKSSSDTFQLLTKSFLWNPRAKFVIITDQNPNHLFKVLAKLHVLNVAALVYKSQDLIEISTYFPYNFSLPQQQRTDGIWLDVCHRGELKQKENLFPEKLPKHWSNVTLKVILVEYPPYVKCSDCDDVNKTGIEIRILRLVQQVLKFKIDYVKKPNITWGIKQPNGSFDGAYGYLQNHDADLGIGFFCANFTESWHFDLSFPYIDDPPKWVVPTASLQPRWKSVAKIFTWRLWIILLITLISTSTILGLIAKLLNDRPCYQNLPNCFLICFRSLLGQGVNLQPKMMAVRVTFVVWAVLSWLTTVAFQSHLMTALNFNTYAKQISTVDELIESGMELGFFDQLTYLFADKVSEADSYIHDNHVSCPMTYACLNRTAFQGNLATIRGDRILKIAITRFYFPNGKSLVYVFPSQVSNMLINMAFSKGAPILDQVNKVLINLKSHGFVELNYQSQAGLTTTRHRKHAVMMGDDTLDIHEMQVMFAMLFLGWLLALTVFIAEQALKPETFLQNCIRTEPEL